jgi:hypothetical protein
MSKGKTAEKSEVIQGMLDLMVAESPLDALGLQHGYGHTGSNK